MNLEKKDVTPASDEGKTLEPSHDPVKDELDKEKGKSKYTETEQAAFSLKKNAERAKELGLDPAAILGVETKKEEDKSSPLTVAEYERREAEKMTRTAEQMADAIEDENERELTKVYLKSRIVPSGDPNKDLNDARSLVNSVKNRQILEMNGNRVTPQSYSTGSGGRPKAPEGEFKPTEEENRFMRDFGLTKEQILKSREQQ